MDILKLINKESLERDEIIELLKIEDEALLSLLYRKTLQIKENFFGNKILLRGIIEFSNYCRQDCYYCGIRLSNDDVTRYRMKIEDILNTANKIYKAGIRTIVLQSGEDIFYDIENIAEIIIKIKNKFDVAITLSLGERTFEEYDFWKSVGADRYLLKHETANPNLYFDLHPYQDFHKRIEHLKYLKKIGYQVGSGNIIGLPNQSLEDIANDILLCKELDVDMASFTPFISAKNTPLETHNNCNLNMVLKTMAIARIVLPNVHIPATTALSTLNPKARKLGLLVGANIIMPTFTPNKYRFNYKIYNNKPGKSESPESKILNIKRLLSDLNMEISYSKGHSLKKLCV